MACYACGTTARRSATSKSTASILKRHAKCVFFDPFFCLVEASRNEEARDAAIGCVALSRLDNQLREQWKTVLPFTELINRWEWPDRLLLVGKEEIGVPGASRQREHLVVIHLADGRMQVAP